MVGGLWVGVVRGWWLLKMLLWLVNDSIAFKGFAND